MPKYQIELTPQNLEFEKIIGVTGYALKNVQAQGGTLRFLGNPDPIILVVDGLSEYQLDKLENGIQAQANVYGGEVLIVTREVHDGQA